MPASPTTLRDERELVAAFEHHELDALVEATELVVVRDASDAELQAAWTTYQQNRGRGWN